jgi:hypothetical protein
MRECIHCGDEFNERSRRKELVGGRINECPDCVEANGGDQSPPKYLGVMAGDGKMAGVTILQFDSEADRQAYAAAHRNNSGQNKGKECQLGTHLTPMSGIKFKTVQKTEATNHKGKL